MEILDDRGFLACARRTAHGEAWMALDGWDGRLAEAVTPPFEAAVDRCLASAADPMPAPAVPPSPVSSP